MVPSHQGLFHFFRSPNSFSYSFLHFKICTACISSARPGHALDFNCQLTPFQGVWDESGSIMRKWQIRSLHSKPFSSNIALWNKSNGSYDIKDFGTLPLIFSTSKYFRRKFQPCPSFFSHPNIPDK